MSGEHRRDLFRYTCNFFGSAYPYMDLAFLGVTYIPHIVFLFLFSLHALLSGFLKFSVDLSIATGVFFIMNKSLFWNEQCITGETA